MIQYMHSHKFLLVSILIVGLCLLNQPSFGEQLSLNEVVDILNFARQSIGYGELKMFAFWPAKPQIPSLDEELQLKQQLNHWQQQYDNAKTLKKRELAAEQLAFYQEQQQYFLKGSATFEEKNVIFVVRPNSVDKDFNEVYDARIHIIDRYRQCTHSRTSSIFEESYLNVNYIYTTIMKSEYNAYLWAKQNNLSGFVEEPVDVSDFPYHLNGRSDFPIDADRVVSFEMITDDKGNDRYLLEFLPSTWSDTDSKTIRLRIDPSRDFCITDRDYLVVHEGKKRIMTRKVFRRYRRFGHIWYPTLIRRLSFAKPGEPRLKFACWIEEADFTGTVSPAIFQIDLRWLASQVPNLDISSSVKLEN